jgi:hypothetical protein
MYLQVPGLQAGTYDLDSSQPPQVISLGGMVNDTDLPGLDADFDRLEISFLWKPMLTMLFAEEERVRRLVRNTKVSWPTQARARLVGRITSILTRPFRWHSAAA